MEKFQSGDKVAWNPALSPNQREALEKGFGPGPFTVHGFEPGAPRGGQWLSLLNSEGLAWISHKHQWESPECEDPSLHKAIPPTFHSDWFVEEDGL